MNQMDDAQMQQVQRELSRMLANIPRDIELRLYTQPGRNDVFNDAARQGIRFFRQLTDKLILREYDLDHESARRSGITHSPTLVFDPDHYDVRWLGAPLGEEGRIFLEALLLIGSRQDALNEQSRRVIDTIDQRRRLRVFVSASCPYCPQQALNALKAAVARPKWISLEIIDVQAGAEIADRYGAHSVPQTFADDVLIAQGAQPEETVHAVA